MAASINKSIHVLSAWFVRVLVKIESNNILYLEPAHNEYDNPHWRYRGDTTTSWSEKYFPVA